MKYIMKTLVSSLALLLIFAMSTSAQDPIKVAPDMHKLLLDNDNVRVYEFHAKPGAKLAMHSHPNHIVYSLNGGKLKFTSPDGKTSEFELTTGAARWVDATTHSVENIGKTDVKVLAIELKDHKGTEGMKKK